MFKCNDRVRVIQSKNVILAEHNADVGKLGTILAVDHPACGIAGGLVVVLDTYHDATGEKIHRSGRFFDPSQCELN